MKRSVLAVLILLLTAALLYPASATAGPPVTVELESYFGICSGTTGQIQIVKECSTEVDPAPDGSDIHTLASIGGDATSNRRAQTGVFYKSGFLNGPEKPVLVTVKVKDGTGATARCGRCDEVWAWGTLSAIVDGTGPGFAETRKRWLAWARDVSPLQDEPPVQGGDVVTLCVPFPEGHSDATLTLFLHSSAGVLTDGQANVDPEVNVTLNLGITSIERVPKCHDQ